MTAIFLSTIFADPNNDVAYITPKAWLTYCVDIAWLVESLVKP